MLPGLKNFFNFSKIPSALVPCIKNDYSPRFCTNNKRHFLTYVLTRVSISTFLSLNLPMFTEEDDATIENEDRKEL